MNPVDIKILKVNEVWSVVDAEPGIIEELYHLYSFDVPGFRFMPSFRKRRWDGKIHLLKKGSNRIYSGLVPRIEQYAKENGYTFESEVEVTQPVTNNPPFTKWYSGGKEIMPHDHQLKAIYKGLKSKRNIFLSPTGSGKSLIIYTLARHSLERKGKTLILVPTTSLVEQLYSDFQDYSNGTWDVEKYVTRIYSGMPRENKKIVISTWQSIYSLPIDAFENFHTIIGDECHLFKSKEISSLLEKLQNAEYRYGFTGTMDDTNVHQLTLEGLFGPVYQVTTTTELIRENKLANFEINCLVLEHPEADRKLNKTNSYEEEVSFINGHVKRNQFIADLAVNTPGNTLILFSRVESHGKILFDLISSQTDRPVHFIYGATETELREDIRKQIEISENSITVASSQIFSTGINIKSLSNIIFAAPSKSRIRTLQSIGRVLRISEKKSIAKVFDISDDLSLNEKPNYTFRHFIERLKIYTNEDFQYKIKKVDLSSL